MPGVPAHELRDMGKADRLGQADQPLWRRRHERKGLLYVLPVLLLFAVMVAYPIVRSFYLSFFDYSILEPDSSRFVGMFENVFVSWDIVPVTILTSSRLPLVRSHLASTAVSPVLRRRHQPAYPPGQPSQASVRS